MEDMIQSLEQRWQSTISKEMSIQKSFFRNFIALIIAFVVLIRTDEKFKFNKKNSDNKSNKKKNTKNMKINEWPRHGIQALWAFDGFDRRKKLWLDRVRKQQKQVKNRRE